VKGRPAEDADTSAAHVPEARPAPEADPVHDDEPDTDAPETAEAGVDGAGVDESGLDERAEQILAFERRWWKHAGAKEQAIRETFGLSATRYYQVLNGLLDDPAALERDPVLVGRLRRLRASRTRRSV
jgi:hypothetical protein